MVGLRANCNRNNPDTIQIDFWSGLPFREVGVLPAS